MATSKLPMSEVLPFVGHRYFDPFVSGASRLAGCLFSLSQHLDTVPWMASWAEVLFGLFTTPAIGALLPFGSFIPITSSLC